MSRFPFLPAPYTFLGGKGYRSTILVHSWHARSGEKHVALSTTLGIMPHLPSDFVEINEAFFSPPTNVHVLKPSDPEKAGFGYLLLMFCHSPHMTSWRQVLFWAPVQCRNSDQRVVRGFTLFSRCRVRRTMSVQSTNCYMVWVVSMVIWQRLIHLRPTKSCQQTTKWRKNAHLPIFYHHVPPLWLAVSCYLTTSFHTHQNPSTKSVSPFQDCDMGNDRYVVEICGTRFQSPFSSTHDSSICIGSLERTKIWPIFGLPGGKQPHFVTSSPGRFPEIRCSETTRPRKEGANIHTSRNQDSTCPRNRRGDCLLMHLTLKSNCHSLSFNTKTKCWEPQEQLWLQSITLMTSHCLLKATSSPILPILPFLTFDSPASISCRSVSTKVS